MINDKNREWKEISARGFFDIKTSETAKTFRAEPPLI
jgi:hypothetical protein